MMKAEDNYHLDQVLNGNTDAFAHLVHQYQDMVFTVAVRIVKNHEDAEEVAQDAFVKAYQSLKNFKRTSKFSTWLYRIAFNAAIDKARQKNMLVESLEKEEYTLDIPEDSLNSIEKITLDERNGIIREAVNALPGDEGTIVTLYYMDDQSVDEISKVMGYSVSNVKVKLFRARKKLFGTLVHLQKEENKIA